MKTIAQQLGVKEFPFEIRDKNGNQIYYEQSNGYWWKSEYDKNGKRIYFKDSEGRWWKSEYDKNGKEIYFKDSEGYWWKSEYDKNGKEIYYENIDGTIRDNRPKVSCNGKVVEIDGKKYELKEINQ